MSLLPHLLSLQVPHPPGTPFFLLLGNIFSKLPIGENLGYRVNMISVISSALSILLSLSHCCKTN
ncbi:MAG: DUF2723 domain-containing protein [Ignavibacteriales bacterium]|nr:DUF2723 domain-containing protein [Ignavibacteriales bacterium]